MVNDALALYLRRERGLAALAAHEAECGVFSDTELAEADRMLNAAGLVDLRKIAEPRLKPQKHTAKSRQARA